MLTQVFKDQDLRQFLLTPPKSIGVTNLLRSVVSTVASGNARNGELPRHLIPKLWKQLGDRKAIVDRGQVCTFNEFSTRVVKLANAMNNFGINEGDRVATFLHNEQAWFDVMAASTVSGIKMPMLSIYLKPNELLQCLINCQPKALVFSEKYLPIVESIRADLTEIEYFIVAGSGPYPEGYLALETLINSAEESLPPGGFGLAQMPFSGGSTGVPKFIVDADIRPENNPLMKGVSKEKMKELKFAFAQGAARLGLGSIKGPIVSMIPGPLYHAGVQTAVIPIFFGATIVPMYKFDAENFLRTIEQEKVNWVFVAPTMLERVLKLPEDVKKKYDLSSMQHVLCAAAPCPAQVKEDINAYFKQQGAKKNVFNEYYGSSEASVISVLRAEDYEGHPHRYKSVGRIYGSECRIFNDETSTWAQPGEEGRILVRNARIYRVQYGNSNEINKSFMEVDGAYWYDDGCIGYLDKDGFLYLTSRSKEMIISGGVNVFPVEIEEVIKSHPDVLDAAVVKVADSDLGEVPGAVIQFKSGVDLDEEAMTAYCKDKGLYGFKLPKQWRSLEEFPRNSAGKLRKVDLEKEFVTQEA